MRLFFQIFIIWCTIGLCLTSCKNGKPTYINNDSTAFYPVKNAFVAEASYLQRNPFYIYQTTSVNNQLKDSIVVSLPQVLQQLKTLETIANIDTLDKKKFYKETAFHDLGTKSVSIMYETNEPNMQVKNITLLLNDETNTIKNVLIKTVDADTSFQYHFKPNKSLRIVKTYTVQNKMVDENIFVNWNDYSRP